MFVYHTKAEHNVISYRFAAESENVVDRVKQKSLCSLRSVNIRVSAQEANEDLSIDLRKAFNNVHYEIFKRRLSLYGVGGKNLDLFSGYLIDRK